MPKGQLSWTMTQQMAHHDSKHCFTHMALPSVAESDVIKALMC